MCSDVCDSVDASDSFDGSNGFDGGFDGSDGGFDGFGGFDGVVVVASMAPMVSMAWVDLMAPELKSEREEVQWFGAHWLHPILRIKPFVLLLFICPLGTVLLKSLHPDATPREKDRSRSLRRVGQN